MEKHRFRLILVYRLAALGLLSGDGKAQVMVSLVGCQGFKKSDWDDGECFITLEGAWRLERVRQARRAPGRVLQQWAPGGGVGTARRKRSSGLAVRGPGAWRFVCSMLMLERCHVRGGTGLVDHMCWTTGGQVRRAGLRAGRFVEAGPRAGSSPFLFVYDDDRVICYTGADVDTGDAEDAQATE
ncbi:hypothetical protein DEO72_LG8g1737 [Vigna unguiculata]|uniref:Uncharacterized protein n=1 Tax=Vigna unguiculata TaxID=3917 RepID=A0A4D6MSV7_VIGUN|nr:hypothetical protein DEO72_LG8g1737 [Vigna unguiculata]